ncbi:family 43 glycosylhydrolase [Paenibacillus sp. MSJ-34]|nr:family 43 glycosylhydrolase [Paenibacillus sp. MSJ-34]
MACVAAALAAGVWTVKRNGGEAGDSASSTYRNPVFEPVFADPALIRGEDGMIYAYATEDDWGDGEGSRVVPILRSGNLQDWEYVGEAFDRKPEWKGGGVWAPDIAYYNGKYYLYYTMSLWGDPDPGIGVAVADSPEGPFTDRGKIFTSSEIGAYSIDPMFFVEDGKPYLFFGSIEAGIFGIELTADGMQTAGDKFQIASSGYEAPYMIKRNGHYYFFGSMGTCCDGADSTYRVAVGRAESLKGPYLNREGGDLLYNEGNVMLTGYFPPEPEGAPFVGPGHNAVITDDRGTDWIVYHAIDVNAPKVGSGATRRPLMIDPIVWEDGWPTVADAKPSVGEREGPVFHRK